MSDQGSNATSLRAMFLGRRRPAQDTAAFHLAQSTRAQPAAPDGVNATTRHLETDPRPLAGRKGWDEQLGALFESQQLVAGHTTRILSLLGSGQQNDVLETATRTMPANGVLIRNFGAPFASIVCLNGSGLGMTVQAEAAGASAQGDGPGSFVVLPGTGSRYSYSVLSRRADPAAGYLCPVTLDVAETIVPLAANATFNGNVYAASGFGTFRAFAASDQAGTLNIQQSRDGLTWYTTNTTAVPGGITNGTVLQSVIAMPFVRVQLVNGPTAETAVELDSSLLRSS
jgi:hypothetical protein